MCISFLYTNPGDDSIKYKLILINNRDEFYKRKTQNATLTQSDNGNLTTIYGIDLAGAVKGTWLGISASNGTIKLGNLANVTGEEHKEGKQGRGPIVTNYIAGNKSIESYNEKLSESSQEFSSFNFLSVEINSNDIKTHYVSNTPKITESLPSGFCGLGNSPMTKPFQKVQTGTEEFKDVLKTHKNCSKDDLINALMNVLKSETKHLPDHELFLRRSESAIHFSSIFVQIPDVSYGTRTRTIILVDEDENIDYIEETMTSDDPNGEWEKTHLKIPKTAKL